MLMKRPAGGWMGSMDDRKRDAIVSGSAYVYLACIALLFSVATAFGKIYGQLILLTLFPVYALYYALMYVLVCRGYKDQLKRLSAFGNGSRTSLTGLLFHLSLYLLIIFALLFLRI